MANNFKNPWESNMWGQGSEEYTQWLPEDAAYFTGVNPNTGESVHSNDGNENETGKIVKSSKILRTDAKSKARSAAVDLVISTPTAQKILAPFINGGQYSKNMIIEFSYEDETRVIDKRKGATDYYIQVDGRWEPFDYRYYNKVTADTIFKIVMWVNHEHTSLSGCASVYAHELTIHAALFLRKTFPVLFNKDAKEFIKEYARSITVPYQFNDVNIIGYQIEEGSHMVYALGLNQYFTNINNEIRKQLEGKELAKFNSLVKADIDRAIKYTADIALNPDTKMFARPTSFIF